LILSIRDEGYSRNASLLTEFDIYVFIDEILVCNIYLQGLDPGFQVRGGGHLKNLRRAEGGANIFGVFRVKK
jgi:hypothetical protein